MVFISRHVLNNTLPSHVCVKLSTCDTRNETSVETTGKIRDELDEIGGGAQWPDSDLDEFAPDVDCEGRLPHDPNRMNQCVGCKGAEAGSLHTLR